MLGTTYYQWRNTSRDSGEEPGPGEAQAVCQKYFRSFFVFSLSLLTPKPSMANYVRPRLLMPRHNMTMCMLLGKPTNDEKPSTNNARPPTLSNANENPKPTLDRCTHCRWCHPFSIFSLHAFVEPSTIHVDTDLWVSYLFPHQGR